MYCNVYFLILFLFLVYKPLPLALCFNKTNAKLNNILLILIDDLRHLYDENVNLHNIKKLAAKSANFKNSFAQQALCAPSRNSILTGRRPDALRLYDFYSYWRHVAGNFTTLPQLLKENGYNTFSVGKVFHPGASSNYIDDYPYSWTTLPYHPPSEIYKNAAICKDIVTKQLQRNLLCPVKVNEQPDKTLPDLQTLKHAMKVLKKKTDKPFFLAVGFHKPHIPFKFPKHYLERVPTDNIRPPNCPKKPEKMPLVAWHPWSDVRKRDDIKRLNISYPMGTMPLDWTIRIKQSYYAAAVYIDDLVGKLINALNINNTIIVLTSDHGWSLGENGLWAKYSNFGVALKVPLLIQVPGAPPNVVETPVELIDIFPTLADLAGIHDVPKCRDTQDGSNMCFEGKSLLPLMEGKKQNAAFAISQYPRPSRKPRRNSDSPRLKDIKIMGYSIRTQRYRYTEWISFNSTSFTRDWSKIYGEELYDHLFDTDESNNVCKEPKYKHQRNKLSKLLRAQINM